MTRKSARVHCLSRIYRVLLYAYPREFRLQFGGDMEQLFRDRYGDVARKNKPLGMSHFALGSLADWVRTSVRERAAAGLGVVSIARKAGPRGFVNEWAVTILMYLFATTTLVQAYVIPTGSMEDNLRVGDHMLVDKVAYGKPGSIGRYVLPYRDIKRGDIVAFLFPEDTRQTFVKRVIGVPGDRIRLVDKQVIRNGRALVEPYIQHVDSAIEVYRDEFPTAPAASTTPLGRKMFADQVVDGELTVPADALFVLGDNRDNSADSRYWGFVPREYVVGKPLLVYWSYEASTADLEEWNVAHLVDVMEHFLDKTRWARTFYVPRSQEAQDGGSR